MCDKMRYTNTKTALSIVTMLRQLGWLRGAWLPVRCGVCGGVHLQKLNQETGNAQQKFNRTNQPAPRTTRREVA